MNGQKMEKQRFMFAKLFERYMVLPWLSEVSKGYIQIATIEAYKLCLVEGDKYLQDCLPRALDLMFNKAICQEEGLPN